MPKMNRMIARILMAAFCISWIVFETAHSAAAEEDSPRYRALLIACDEFLTASNMSPIGENNLDIMEDLLAEDTRAFEVKRQYNISSSKETLAYAIKWAFADAKEGDVSLLYISTHGDFYTTHNNPEGVLLLSDGSLEDIVTASELNAMLDKVPGTKVLLVDACNSGALIGKGVSPDVGSARVARTFQSADYKVLTSSGASEPSWYLTSALEHAPPGSSNFTTAMAVGAGLIGAYAADGNRDGTITLHEMYDYLWTNQASSVVQIYPQDDSYPLFVYDRGRLVDDIHGELTGFEFGNITLDPNKPVLEFSYTATVDTHVAYRITYWQNKQWDWTNGETLRDRTEFDGDADPQGNVSPGRKQISLDLSEILPDGWTYGMIHIMTTGDIREGRQPFIYISRVFRAMQQGGDPALSVKASGKWNQRARPELEIFVEHALPCRLTVTVRDEEGTQVRRLVTSRSTRPQSLTPDGSLLYWNGLDGDGEPVPPGTYTIEATARINKTEYTSSTTTIID